MDRGPARIGELMATGIETHIGITLGLYGHLMPGSEDEAATLLDAYLAREVYASTSTEQLKAAP
jgi:hypothetical protein